SNTATISSINKNAMQDRGVITDTKTSFDSLTQLGTYSIKSSGLPKMPEQHYGTLVVSGSAGSGWISQQFVADTTGNVYTRVFSNNAWSAWKQGGSQDAINQVKQTADSNSATIRNVQGDVSTLKQTATGIKSTLASHEGDIHTLQADSKSLKDSMVNAQGDISTLRKTATDVTSELEDHTGRLSK
ncbi:pyocin knob domain-containing protein, partial [Limosilactobacillus reuteri]|uniref:pyocin knob domain-containing protein n=1 Tax=Limosilactobacillus reuteri TaxID=1598 RepID=UPI001E53FC6E